MTKMNFNGQWIDNLYVDPHRGLGPGVENTTVKVGQSTGETFLHSTKTKRTIVVDYQIYGSTRRELELTLADKLYTDDVVPIIFSDKPNEVWYGKLDELPTMEKPGVSATGTFSLLVPDGLSHALTPTTASNMPYKDVPVNLISGSYDSSWGFARNSDATIEKVTMDSGEVALHVIGTNGTSGFYAKFNFPSGIYTASVEVKGTGTIGRLGWKGISQNGMTPTSDWQRVSRTGSIDSGTVFVFYGAMDVYVRLLKVEEGTTASPWSPNPADHEYYSDTITLTNNGTVPTPLHVTAEMRSDNGFLGLTLDDNQPYQVGNPDEIDGVTYNPSQMLVPAMPTLDKYTVNDPKYQVIPPSQGVMKQQGSLQQTSDKHISAKDFGPTPSVKGPRGPAMIYTLPADNEGNKGAKNWTFRVHDGFGSRRNQPRDVGQLCATVLDINGKSIASLIVADLSQTGNEFLLRFDVNQKQVRLQRMTWKDWDGSGFTAHYYIRKSGNIFTFGWARESKSYSYVCDELADTQAYYVSFSFLKWMDVPTPAYYGLINWNFRKDMVDEFKNLPNYFTDGDLVNLDSKTNTLTINGYPDWDRVDIASEPLLVPPGKSTLGIVYSTFAKPPKVTVDFEERWL